MKIKIIVLLSKFKLLCCLKKIQEALNSRVKLEAASSQACLAANTIRINLPQHPILTSAIEVIRLICEESYNKEIAGKMALRVRTIEGYRERIQEK